jgi:hypothetical protein
LIERRDPYEAAEYIGRARRLWKGKASEIDVVLHGMRKELSRRQSAEDNPAEL